MNILSSASRIGLLAAGLALTSGISIAQQAAPPRGPEAQEALNRLPDNVGTGRFAAMKEEVASLPDHVVYPRKIWHHCVRSSSV